jgi:myo-inositol-1(or 4)-monophosphatase
MEDILIAAKEVAIHAVQEAGDLAKEYFDKEKEVVEKGDHGDLVTIVDRLAEDIILNSILARFPDHQIRGEETGWTGDEGDWLWLVDPLDGTNNYAVGLPVYGVSITLIYKKEPVLGVIYESHLGNLYVAERGKGATCNGEAISIKKGSVLPRLTVGWIQGHQVQKDKRAMSLKHRLDGEFKRVVRLWAPSIQWCMLARGDLDGIVLYNSEGDDLYAGVLMAKEAGAAVIDFAGQDFEGMQAEPYIIACHPDYKQAFMDIVGQSMKLGDQYN